MQYPRPPSSFSVTVRNQPTIGPVRFPDNSLKKIRSLSIARSGSGLLFFFLGSDDQRSSTTTYPWWYSNSMTIPVSILLCVLVVVILLVGTATSSPCTAQYCPYTTVDIPSLKSNAPKTVVLGSVYYNPFVDYLGITRMGVEAVNNDPTVLPDVRIVLYLPEVLIL